MCENFRQIILAFMACQHSPLHLFDSSAHHEEFLACPIRKLGIRMSGESGGHWLTHVYLENAIRMVYACVSVMCNVLNHM